MKKNLFILAVAGLALASCSNDETVNSLATSGASEISFNSFMSGVTRASANGPMSNFADGDQINVYASYYNGTADVKYFQDDFTKQAGSTGFTSTQKHYWPDMADPKKMTFTAIYGATQSTTTVGEITSYSPATAVADQKDVLVARHVSDDKETPVPMNFRHALSQIVLKVKNDNPSLRITIKAFQIGYVDKTGTFQLDRTSTTSIPNTDTPEAAADGNTGSITTNVTLLPATKWSNTAATAPTSNYIQTLTSDKVFNGTNTSEVATLGSAWLLLPQTKTAGTDYVNSTANVTVDANTEPNLNNAYFAVKMVIDSYNGSEVTASLATERWCCWPVALTWNPGYKYTYTINLGDGGYQPADVDGTAGLDPVLGDAIVFSPTCTIDAWVVSDSNVPAAPQP